ncbi:hypothetical protein HYALB_00002013 [Hymenoscyphus albidus]|uniref:Uncharacterized protein n=1 Tax=Hymenoscyphus albidus TaxID=595503 RepID=A0A9N9Q2U7_9HELO|nr:hypothetical protein HYALB_00002013 [Hymenoscyphus albidus]
MYCRFYLSSREGAGRQTISRDIVVMRKSLQDNEDLEPFKPGPLVQFITKLTVPLLELTNFDSGTPGAPAYKPKCHHRIEER